MNLAGKIDHTLLKAEASQDEIRNLVAEAVEHRFASVCVNGVYVAEVAKGLRGSGVKACAVVGFPLGANKSTVKAIEATVAVKDGAQEIDFVAHLPALLACDLGAARTEFLEIVKAARSVDPRVIIKVIIESALLLKDSDRGRGEARIETACRAARETGCDFVKTSSGLHPAGGASVNAVRLMKQYAEGSGGGGGDRGAGGLSVKAAGGIRTYQDAVAMLDAGADRLGSSASVAIVTDCHAAGGGSASSVSA